MDATTVIVALASLAALYMAWTIGANDVANAMGTSIGSGSITLRKALIIAAIFEFSGAVFAGGRVTSTVEQGIVHLNDFANHPMLIAVGMTCCLLATALWINIATYAGWPVSTTHSIIGAVVGFGITAGGLKVIEWSTIGSIFASWVISPLMGGTISYCLFSTISRLILTREQPLASVKRWGPMLVIPITFIMSLSLLFKGLKPLHLNIPLWTSLWISSLFACVSSLIAVPVIGRITRINPEMPSNFDTHLRQTEKVFAVLQVMTVCFIAFAHGSNDVSNAIGPLTAVIDAVHHNLHSVTDDKHHYRILLIGATGMVIGLATYGYKVILTVGKKITQLTPSRGFCAEFSAATTILLASKLGLPISTTHTLVGAVVGVGLGRGLSAIDTKVLSRICYSWMITLPFTGLLTTILFTISRLVVDPTVWVR